MKGFSGRTAIVIGAGSGLGRELVAESCQVAMCDISKDGMAETNLLATG